ncbi:pentatricopeptide repeat-containing protein At2g02750 [Prosopis cineraria]|uniref:pentatricopeptide repeat-containing protein At2g02750 n=1 Tax=Prosopis cineraria TaxID=364024 RepID=UPI00240F43D1|nr:pentatricopeptide repeat-containing protein At2g02750 [Prosopis cineraria]XP_054823560.1 pentatricopeptide repeat-containing protein At2g02750 [Prosopis cineraria]XP_054823561.1 pentatricopeptide repeat-containing protein At2g02750 [Prosopis cineraria]XP_054823562.1 pentatricopeptide repeat-containing protein At2g02750 [Prosopis cineraria]
MKRDIAKLVSDGLYREALHIYSQLHSASHSPQSFTFPPLLKACSILKSPSQGQILHAHVIKFGFQADTYASTALTAMYMKLHRLIDALMVFDDMPHRNVASLNAAVSGLSKNGYHGVALRVFKLMGYGNLRPNSVTLASLLSACDGVNSGEQIHCWAVKLGVESDTYVATSLISMYSNAEELDSANRVYGGLVNKNVVSYNAFITGLLQNGVPCLVVDVFKDMMVCSNDKPNSVTLVSVLSACAGLLDVRFGSQVHGFIAKLVTGIEVMVVTALVDMYSKCGCWHSAFDVFKTLEGNRNLVTWNTMIAGMMLNAQFEKAAELFQLLVFEGMHPDSVTWNSMISGFAQQGKSVEAFLWFRKMMLAGMAPSLKILTSLLSACSDLSALRHGKEIHGLALRIDINRDEFLVTALIDMYMKCGHSSWARAIFDQFEIKPNDPAFWNAMISGYGRNGDKESAFGIFDEMQEQTVQPNGATFVSVLSACSHTGEVERGLQIFRMMKRDYGLHPNPEHVGCVVDLLGRCGRLDEARDLVEELKEPSSSVYSSLLGACRSYLNCNLGKEMAMKLLDLEPENPTPLVILSNIYAGLGRWRDVEIVRGMIKDIGLDKLRGFSMIEVT